eukprot:TRINITY_DN4056_c0_g3_i1.p1 TRINITY_DN4056_c0_g3~~TRINITY_DN4056_c0_g3_i1.p1  ORF type:complete len:148 (-),score=29.90 TRINITY_DN4056_c0_g3_i1:29-472(-)
MSTRAHASAVFPIPIDVVWKSVRDFTFPAKLIPTIKSADMDDNANPATVGAVRKIIWHSGEWRKQRLLELSDQNYRVVWETIEAEPITEATAVITTLELHRITENNHTLVSWSSDFSADVKGDLVKYEQKAYAENLNDMRKTLTSQK